MADKYTYFEDFSPGDTHETVAVRVSAQSIIAFAESFDPQPMHVSVSVPGGLLASGWHTASLTMRLFVTCGWYRPPPGSLGLGVTDLSWHRPVRPADSIRLWIEVVGARPSASKPRFGVLTNRFTTLNQRDEIVQTMISSALVARR